MAKDTLQINPKKPPTKCTMKQTTVPKTNERPKAKVAKVMRSAAAAPSTKEATMKPAVIKEDPTGMAQ